jgi:mRNA interferase RelE/StbE
MALYKLHFRASALKELEKAPKADQIKILKRINNLALNPRPYGYKKLVNRDEYRLRQGDYRIIYSIHDSELVVWIIQIDRRDDVYRVSEEKAKYEAGNPNPKTSKSKT